MKNIKAFELFAEAVGKTVNQQYRFQNALEWLEAECCDLRCVSAPTGGGDYEVEWLVISHHQAEPQEREVGRGRTPLLAIEAAKGA